MPLVLGYTTMHCISVVIGIGRSKKRDTFHIKTNHSCVVFIIEQGVENVYYGPEKNQSLVKN